MEDGQRYTMAKLPLFQALTEHPLFAKVPQVVLVVLGAITAAFLLIFKFFYILVITGILYFVAVILSAGDAQFFDCYQKYIKKHDYYST
ncbi:VirB3 family type IV secretion system protein [Anaerovibrio sp.]|uniref:VirB3 family type IV secretion system protein n=1 Tax=Anaerovibrio sp. TaxID=1872532 RepID=UPI003F154433